MFNVCQTAFVLWAWMTFVCVAQQGYYREIFYNISGTDIVDLTSASKYPDNPDDEWIVNSEFEVPVNIAEFYGQRLRAYIKPFKSGYHTFYIASDDEGQLWFSLNEYPENINLIALVSGHTGSRVWDKEPANQQSDPIYLTAGQRYYVEVLHKEGGGLDHCAIGWVQPGESAISVVPADAITPYIPPPEITRQPHSVTVYEQFVGRDMVTFSVEVRRTTAVTYQWQVNGADIPGATEPVYSLLSSFRHNNKLFRCVVSSPEDVVVSAEACFTVIPDNEPPELIEANCFHDFYCLKLMFSEELSSNTSSDPLDYVVSGRAVSAVQVIPREHMIVLSLSEPVRPGEQIALTFSVEDAADPANQLTLTEYLYALPSYDGAPLGLVLGENEPAGPSSRRTPLVMTEIQHTPAQRMDAGDLRFVELYNSEPFFVEIGGYKFSGAFEYEIPKGTRIPANGYLVVAPAPADMSAAYGALSVIGGFAAEGFSGGGSISLSDEAGAWLTTVNYSDRPPWPLAAVGTGHSLVLRRPSAGEVNVEAWGVSAYRGGSPGSADPLISHGYEGVVFNEVLPHPGGGGDGFVEFYNATDAAIDLSGCELRVDDPSVPGFVLPTGAVVAGGGYLVLTESQCGFFINGRGDKLYFYAPEAAGAMVIDAFEFDDQAAGVAYGRTPDGARYWNRLTLPSPGAPNARRYAAPVILNELMYHTLSEKGTEEYVELHNTTALDISLAGWKLSGDIEYSFATEVIAAHDYLIVPRNREVFATLYPEVITVAAGGYSGSLSNKRGTVRLEQPALVMDTNDGGAPVAKEKCVVVENVTYRDGGNWHKRADGQGSSLERVDPRADPMFAASWRASDENMRSEWVTLEFSGRVDHGFTAEVGIPDEIHIGLAGAGECLIDSVELFEEGGENLVNNSSFEEDGVDWSFMGTHDETAIVLSAEARDGSRVLHLKASERAHTGANCVRGKLKRAMAVSGNATIRVQARWLSGNPELLIRSKGNWIEAAGSIVTTRQFGTPGASNSAAKMNAPPAITEVIHQPLLPRNGEAVEVFARVNDCDALRDVRLWYRVDGGGGQYSVDMRPCAAGFFKGVIPGGQPDDALIAFYVEARDLGMPTQIARFPATAPLREALVRYNEPLDQRNFGVYRFWLSKKNYDYWNSRQNGSNKPVDITFIYNNRAVYEAGIMFSGSPFHEGRYTVPINSSGTIDYKIEFAGDDEVMDSGRLVLASPGQLGNDTIGVKEQFNYELVRALGLANPRRRFVHLYANGLEQGQRKIYEDSEKPNRDYVERWFPDAPDNELYKIDDWFEFDLEESTRANVNATLQPFYTPAPDGDGEILKLGRYRWNWQKRGADNFRHNDYTNLFSLITGLNLSDSTTYSRFVRERVNIDAFAGVIAMNHFICNYDSYGYSRGKNMFMYESLTGWALVAWDMDFQFAADRLATTMNPLLSSYPVHDPVMRKYLCEPQVTRSYWRAVIDMLAVAERDTGVRDAIRAKYDALQADSTALTGDYNAHFALVEQRCDIVKAELQSLNPSAFTVSSPAALTSYSSDNLAMISGMAPFEVVSIEINGVDTPVQWISSTTWSAQVVLNSGVNTFIIQGRDRDGGLASGSPVTRQIVYDGPTLDSMDEHLVISEIMTQPVIDGAGYVEILNTSQSTVMNLAGLYVEGVISFTFPNGARLAPGECLLLVENEEIFSSVYGTDATLRIVGCYSGALNPVGGAVVLKRPANGFELDDPILDRVDYGAGFPWPEVASPGSSLQLVNPSVSSARPSNWQVISVSQESVTNCVVDWSALWRYYTLGYPGTGWNAPEFTDSFWPAGAGPLGWETGTTLPIPLATTFSLSGRIAYYFRTTFDFNGDSSASGLLLSYMVDDGAVFYLNGSEVHRSSLMPQGEITQNSAAIKAKQPEGEIEGRFVIDARALRQGQNLLAVGVHQNQTGSSDLVFGMKLENIDFGQRVNSPGMVNIIDDPIDSLPEVRINEIQTLNVSGIVDEEGEREPWVELYNNEAESVSLAGWRISFNRFDPGWTFPQGVTIEPGGFLRIWMDGEVPANQDLANLHTVFRYSFAAGTLMLSDDQGVMIDYLEFPTLDVDSSFGCWPDGSIENRRVLNPPTPLSTNRADKAELVVVINEFMASNGRFVNPLTGDYDDWIELFNDGCADADLGGWMITDKLSSTFPPQPDLSKTFVVPDGITLAPGAALRIWTGADNAAELPFDSDNMQAPFGLGKSGDSIYLFDKRTILVDRIDYAVEDDDTASIGRWENGASGELTVFQEPTPGAPNRNPRFGTGYLRQPPTLRIPECVSFSYTNVFQAARPAKFEFRVFPLAGGQLPQGLFFDQTSGVLSWTPSEEQGPGLYQFNLVGCIVDSVNVTVCDHLLLTLMVEERPSLPEIDPIASITVDEGALVEFNVNARRSIEIPHYETFTNLRLEGDLSVAAEFDQQSGAFRWQTDEIDGPGVYHIRVIAEDSTMPEILTESVVSVTVNEVNQPFTYLSPKTFYLWNNESFATHLKVSDPDLPSNKISYVVITKPAGCTLNIDSGLLSWQPAAGYAGSEKVRLRIYDNAGASQLIDVTLAVAAMNLQTDHLTVEPDGTLKMQWLSRPDTTYFVEWSPTLEVGEWRTLNAYAPVVGTGSQIFYIIDPAQSDLPARAFFRLKQHRE